MKSQAKLNKTAAGSSKMRIAVDTVIYRQGWSLIPALSIQ